MNSIYNFHEVSDQLACSGQPTADQLKQLAAENYKVIINLGLPNTKYSLPDEAASVKAADMDYCHIPVVFEDPKVSELADFIKFMQSQDDQKTLVHCAANYRASAFTGLYLFAMDKLDEKQMRSFIEDVWKPDAVWQQFIDDSLEFLREVKG
jgi:protein tyrosine phosphatase (PTP) superfamily phosphohydrolase (DUF442 family)